MNKKYEKYKYEAYMAFSFALGFALGALIEYILCC